MSAHDQIRAMLDELMGTGRDGENNKYKVKFDDPRVCKSFLLGCCPHDILSSTRMDLGECPKIHDLALRADYEQATKGKDYYYDIDAMEHLQSFIAECDRKTELAKRRLKETQEELSEEANQKAEIIHQLCEQIGTKLAKAETAGAEGLVDESLKAMEEVEELKKQKGQAEIEYRNSMPASSYQQQKLRVCEVCSAYLGIHDNDRRLADHFGGKLHLGFITIREKLEDLKKSVAERRAQREKEREERRKREQEKLGEREKEKRKSRSPSRNHRSSRSHSRDRRKRSRSRSRSRRSAKRSRSRSRSHSRRSDSRKRSRSRSRSRYSSRHSGKYGNNSRRRSRSRSGSKSENKSRRRDSRSRSASSSRKEGGGGGEGRDSRERSGSSSREEMMRRDGRLDG